MGIQIGKKGFLLIIVSLLGGGQILFSQSSAGHLSEPSGKDFIFLRSAMGFRGPVGWKMQRAAMVKAGGEVISSNEYRPSGWYDAVVPGTVLTSLVQDAVYPDPYFGDNNRLNRHLIPDIADSGREFYHYWYRTEFRLPVTFSGKRVWLKFNGINYRCKIWLNGEMIGTMAGMFSEEKMDITALARFKSKNVLAVDILPVDFPGSNRPSKGKMPGAIREAKNGGDGEIGKNVTMLMSGGWDFTFHDGIRDRNTGIWKDVELFATGDLVLQHAYVQSLLPLPDTSSSREIVSVEVYNASDKIQRGALSGSIAGTGINFKKEVMLRPRERKQIVFNPKQFPQLKLKNPNLWWPVNKGRQYLYNLNLKFLTNRGVSNEIHTRFGVRQISSDQHTPDSSRRFLVNGVPVFIRGSNWIPEGMCRNSEKRTYAELRCTRQAGINFLRLWGGGITESDYFYRLCDEFGIMVWSEFWITGNTRFPVDTALYLGNLLASVKRIRGHASVAYYVSANESTDLPGALRVIRSADSVTGYQRESECCGVHDGSPYKYVNPMQYYDNTASARGSRVNGFNPEYGAPCLPTVECLREMMPEKDLWPVNDSVWNYLDGGGFHGMTSTYTEAVNEFGKSNSIEAFAQKAQFVGAMNYRSIWEVWNYNKFGYGDRFCSGLLFWYNNSPVRQTAGRMWDWSLEPTAALYYTQNALRPLHAQFDYLKNTVSVCNDYRIAFPGYHLKATLYDFNMKIRFNKELSLNIPEDGVVNDAIKIDFPADITRVHFIRLELLDEKNGPVSETFYWRSNDKYEKTGKLAGPAVSGFGDINHLPPANLKVTVKKEIKRGKLLLHVVVRNPGKTLAFFTRLRLLNDDGKPVKPAFYSDNFFSVLPGLTRRVSIEVAREEISGKKVRLSVGGWNIKRMDFPENLSR